MGKRKRERHSRRRKDEKNGEGIGAAVYGDMCVDGSDKDIN